MRASTLSNLSLEPNKLTFAGVTVAANDPKAMPLSRMMGFFPFG